MGASGGGRGVKGDRVTHSQVNEQEHCSRFRFNIHLDCSGTNKVRNSVPVLVPVPGPIGSNTGREGELDSQVNEE